ncbi:solute carrier family 53 member 1-like [Culicoides brevitarsis]|uniref:solute carrier family 53 member 1-like n=1 Tax=Culicoides brevitarsis TaxID=469753 RepID=UPI00307C8C2A
MKFAEHLSAHVTPEWKKQYLNYEVMKYMLYKAVEESPSREFVDPDLLNRYFFKFNETFFAYCSTELEKINTFYAEKLTEAARLFTNLRAKLCEAQQNGFRHKNNCFQSSAVLRSRHHPKQKLKELRFAFSEFYLFLVYLQNYQQLNFTGFRKILKKYDKILHSDLGTRWRSDHVDIAHFCINQDIERMMHQAENIVTQEIEGGDRQKAMSLLRVPQKKKNFTPWNTFRIGLLTGYLLVLLVAVVLSAAFYYQRNDWQVAFKLYRGPFLMVEFLFIWSINLYAWRSYGVNHILIFELDPRNYITAQHMLELAVIFGIIWCISVLGFIYSDLLKIPAFLNPLLLYITIAVFIFNPTKCCYYKARLWAVKIGFRVLFAPLLFVHFADFWMADQTNSMVPIFLDLQTFFCFYSKNSNLSYVDEDNICLTQRSYIRPIFAMLPAWFRCAQCLRRFVDTKLVFPHLVNAVKYTTGILVVVFSVATSVTNEKYRKVTDNPWFYVWVSDAVIFSIYAYAWDVRQDFDLWDCKAQVNTKCLRDELIYESKAFYWFGIFEDLVMRFVTTFTISLTEMGFITNHFVISILNILEVARRCIWNYFRLENEHLNNCKKQRATREIKLN